MRNVYSAKYRAFAGLAVVMLFSIPASFCAAAPYSDAVLANNPVLYWQLNETSGTTAVNTGTGLAPLNGTYVNIPGNGTTNVSNYGQAGPQPVLFSGFESTNRAVLFDPENTATTSTSTTNPGVQLASSSGSALAFSSAVTLEAWIYRNAQETTNSNNSEGIVSRFVGNVGGGAVSQRSYVLYYDANATPSTGNNAAGGGTIGASSGGTGAIGFQVSSTGANVSTSNVYSTVNIPLGEWTHLAAVFDGTSQTMSLYINGLLNQSIADQVLGRTVPATLYTGDSIFQVGTQFGQNNPFVFEGAVDEVAVYGSALSGGAILGNYQAAFVPEPTGLALAAMGLVGLTAARRRSKR